MKFAPKEESSPVSIMKQKKSNPVPIEVPETSKNQNDFKRPSTNDQRYSNQPNALAD
jgi:hypothetical protein